MHCPFCKAIDTRVVDSRLAEDGAQVRRRRECEHCGSRFTTFERAQLSMPNIVKRSGDPEPFSEEKLRRGMESAVYKRPVSAERLDHAIESIKRKLRATSDREVNSQQLGEWVMEELRDLDHVAYVRFASIYRSFEDVNAFREEIERLQTLPTAEQRRSQMSLIDPESPQTPPAPPRGVR
ncbi:transcriptional repressor NrdR [Sinimarinibacterium sp. CAU 1509]|uniref:transcriptional regulator NrdR n=1 Tax=Sinimarinibacterium sp. CAU 1509 TaxID=2562283 RepID=UPI0010ACD7FC|nr:transcriptional regulator NrdR [Sinimarinibacterium sp. CAU 1509]TJY60875.1 transcriptional repressor NrdR [Sinimarinibacterium sp. CAU 1509]